VGQRAEPPPGQANDGIRQPIGVNTVQAAPYNLNGSGVDILIYDGGIVTATHADFSGRITVPDVASVCDHATHVAGSGSLSASADGSANQWRGDVFDQYKQRFLSREPVAQSCLHAPKPVL